MPSVSHTLTNENTPSASVSKTHLSASRRSALARCERRAPARAIARGDRSAFQRLTFTEERAPVASRRASSSIASMRRFIGASSPFSPRC